MTWIARWQAYAAYLGLAVLTVALAFFSGRHSGATAQKAVAIKTKLKVIDDARKIERQVDGYSDADARQRLQRWTVKR